jgi:hypothetical protein
VRYLYQAFCLMVLMVVGQQGAIVHELGHLSGAHAGDVHCDSSETAETNCALCPSFAQVATPAFSHSFIVPLLLRAQITRSAEPPIAAADTARLTPRSRGPPAAS